jgi:Predicted flavoproteins
LPSSVIDVCVNIAAISDTKKANQITADERKRLVSFLKNFCLTIAKTRPLEEAIVTKGGVSTKEINPRTMESRIQKGLYFCGEIIDVDGDTGGYNLQAAFSTGYLAGKSAAESLNYA